MGILVALIAVCMVSGASAQLSDDQASNELRKVIPILRDTMVVDDYSAEGFRGRDVYFDPPRTVVLEYEYNWALSDSSLTLETLGPFEAAMENQVKSLWCSEPTLKYWRDNNLYQTFLYRDNTGLMLVKIESENIDC